MSWLVLKEGKFWASYEDKSSAEAEVRRLREKKEVAYAVPGNSMPYADDYDDEY